jgi:hypothetical protein
MRNLLDLAKYCWPGEPMHPKAGSFAIPSPTDGQVLKVIASNDIGWDHVSVSRKKRCPNWPEMERVAQLFFEDDERAFQLHVPASDHINDHPYCLHWWRPHFEAIPKPPAWLVGGVKPDEAIVLYREEEARLKAEGLINGGLLR